MEKEEEWNPGYMDIKKGWISFDKAWYCNENKLIHYSEKEFKKCVHCQKKS